MKRIISFFIVLFIFITNFNLKVSASYFKPYQVKIISDINIRSSPSLKSKVVGKYKKGSVVTVLGKNGIFLKTNKGYIYNSSKFIEAFYSFKPYKAVVKADVLNIRQLPSLSSKIVGRYYKGNIITIIGSTGKFLKTNKGYVLKDYVSVFEANRNDNALVGRYLKIKEDVYLLKGTDGTLSDRLLIKGRTYKILGVEGDYYKISFGSLKGFVHKDYVEILNNEPYDKISLAWQYVYNKSRNPYTYDEPSDYVNIKSSSLGLNVLSPTWFDIVGDYKNPSTIDVENNADLEYVKRAHKNGYEVWPRFAEFNSERAYVVFTNPSLRSKIINKIVSYAKNYNVDGINIDFEALGMKNKDLFTAFVKDLSRELKKYNLTVSVDVTKISTSDTWSRWYDRKELINYVDYMILMAYDEYTEKSKTPGSVGSYPWVKASIEEFLNLGIPKEKLILGVPFYVRLYKVDAYNTVLSSQAISTEKVLSLVSENNGQVYFDEKSRQNVAVYYKNGYKYIAWLEDETSMAWRLDLLNQYSLKGLGAWCLGWESKVIWDVIKSKLK